MDKNTFVVDSHVHTYPSVEIGRQAVGTNGYGYAGTIAELQEVMKNGRISRSVMANNTPVLEMKKANVAKIPSNLDGAQREKEIQGIEKKMVERLQRRNQWTCQTARENPNLVASLSLDPLQGSEGMVAELENKVVAMGAKGLKLHPLVSEFYPGDRRMWPVYGKAQELGIPVLFHSGGSELPGYDSQYARPSQFEKMAPAFPGLTVILGHFGRGYYDEVIPLARKSPNLFFDTAACFQLPGSNPEDQAALVCEMIKKVGAKRVLFGSDWPWFDPIRDIQLIKKMDLSDEEKTLVLGLNAKRIYKL
jgi:predicted TIM-barrel fold metal-dependent hydrolase